MQIYYYEESDASQRAPHLGTPLPSSSLAPLGVIAHHFPEISHVDSLAVTRGYKNRDTITVSRAGLGAAYDTKVASFFEEHLHEDEEIRYILDGRGYFDVRGEGERWVRCALEKGDLLILPAGIWHRFTTDESDYIKALRLFKDEPKWTPLNRTSEMEENEARKEYVQSVAAATATAE